MLLMLINSSAKEHAPFIKTTLILLPFAFVCGCGTFNPTKPPGGRSGTSLPIDQVPMYGGMDRQAVPSLKKGDDDLISGASSAFGSREKAAVAWIEQGFRFYKSDQNEKAMRRFNQAWLLDPKNPEVYWGFGSVLHDRNQAFAGYDMLKRAYDLGFRNPEFLADLGNMALVRIVERKDLSDEQREAFKKESEGYYEEAVKSQSHLAYIYENWATARYCQEDYQGAWEKIALARKFGELSSPGFLQVLSAKMPEPK